MQLRLLSDLHIDACPLPSLPSAGEDLVVLAGDISDGPAGIEWAARAFPQVPIVYVLGNHECYGHSPGQALERAREAAEREGRGRIHLLENEARVIGGIRFIGASLWTDFSLFGIDPESLARAKAACRRSLSDYRCIHAEPGPEPRPFLPDDTVLLHRRSRQYLALALSSGDPARTVVVTHHAPHRGSLAPAHAEDLVSAGFVTDLKILMGRAALWVHGHTHDSFDYPAGGTRVVCNPRGYCRADGRVCENPGFDPGLRVAV
jgi:predicted phosphodiesterase